MSEKLEVCEGASSGLKRRDFIKAIAAAPLAGDVAGLGVDRALASAGAGGGNGKRHLVGKKLPPWRPGEFQVHFIYTGVAESMFWIMPDGTSMLLDCGDHPAINRGKLAVWVLPNGGRHSGEWISRYVTRVNPKGADVDYLMISHHHCDHAGQDGWGRGTREWKGQVLSVGGILQAADVLKFRHGFDRGWPNFDEPIPNERCDRAAASYSHIRKVLSYLIERDGLEMEKFEVGAVNQVSMRSEPAAYPKFRVTNIAGNGKILCGDGHVRNLYSGFSGAKSINENALSLGLLVEYGPFRFYSAGDFSCRQKMGDGSVVEIEAELAKELSAVDVAKVNHHGFHSMPKELVSALRARVWTSCVWDRLHMTFDTLERLTSRESYPGPRLVAPCVFPPERRIEDAGRRFLSDIAVEAFEAGHVVLSVEPGGKRYSVAYVTADDESMTVKGVYDFNSAVVSS